MKDGKKTKSILKGASFFLATFAFVGMLAMGTRFVKHKDYNNAGSQIVAVAAVGDTASIEYKYKVGDGAYNVVDKFVGEAETVHTFGQTTNLVDGKVAGYYFLGWYDNADCTGDALTTLDSSLEGNEDDTITLYAKLEVATTRTLTAQTVEHGTYHLSSTTGRYGEVITLVADTADENYEIKGGYYTDTEGNNRVDFEKTTFECPDFDALVYANFGKHQFNVSIGCLDDNYYDCSFMISADSAQEGDEITINIYLAEGYGVRALGYMSEDENNNDIFVPITQQGENENEYVFTMPAQDVGVLVQFGETFDANWTQFKFNHSSEIVNNVTTFVSATNMQNEEGDTYIDTNVYARISGDTLYLFSTNSNKVVLPSNCLAFFADQISKARYENLTNVLLDNLDTSNVTDMAFMFMGCEGITNLDLSGFDTSSLVKMEGMFLGCSSLTNIVYGENFDTSNVTHVDFLFSGCDALTTLDLSSYDFSNARPSIFVDGANTRIIGSLESTALKIIMPKALPTTYYDAECNYSEDAKTYDIVFNIKVDDAENSANCNATYSYKLQNNNFATTGTLLTDFPVSTAGTKQVIYRTDMLHNVTVDSTIQNGTVTVDYAKYVENETVTINATPASGYDVEAYYYYQVGSPENKMSVENATFSMPNYDVVVGAEFTVPSAIIYKNEGGADFVGNFDGNYPTTHTNLAKELKVPTRAGYHFAGWYLDQDCTENSLASQEWDSELGVNVTKYYLPANQVGDTTVYAKWAPTLNMTLWEAFKEDYAAALANVERVTTLVNQEVQTGDSQLGENIYARIYDNAGTQTLVLYSTTDKIYLYDDSKQFFADAFSNVVSMDLTKFDTTYVTDISEMFNGCSALTSLDLSSFALNDGVVVSDIFTGCNTLQTIYTPQRYPLLTGDDHIDLPGYWTSDGYGGYINYMEYFTNSTTENRQEISRVVLLEVNVDPNQGFGTINWAEGSVLNMVAKNAAVTVEGTNVLVDGQVVATANGEEYGYTTTFTGWAGLDTIGTDSISLVANFTRVANQHTVTFDTNGGTLNEESRQITFGENYGVLPTPTREGYVFDGWYVRVEEDWIGRYEFSDELKAWAVENGVDLSSYSPEIMWPTKRLIPDNQTYLFDVDSTLVASWTKEGWLSDYKWEMFKIQNAQQFVGEDLTAIISYHVKKVKTATNMASTEGDYDLGGGNYARIDGDTLWIFSTTASKIMLPEDTSFFFNLYAQSWFDEKPHTSAGFNYIFGGIEEFDLSAFDTSNVKDMSFMFAGALMGATAEHSNIDVSGFNTANVTNMTGMFAGYSGDTLNLTNFDTHNVTNMKYMFASASKLTSLDLSSFNTANVTDMEMMFQQCNKLTSLNLASFNTANVTDMKGMFNYCSSLENLNVTSFNTANVTNMAGMFAGCTALESIDVTGFNTEKVTEADQMFSGCSWLRNIDLSSFDLSKLTEVGKNVVHFNIGVSYDCHYFDMFKDCDMLMYIVLPKAICDRINNPEEFVEGGEYWYFNLPGTFALASDNYTTRGTSMWDFAENLSTAQEKQTIAKVVPITIQSNNQEYGTVDVEELTYYGDQTVEFEGNTIKVNGVVAATATPKTSQTEGVLYVFDEWEGEGYDIVAAFSQINGYTISYNLNGGTATNPTYYTAQNTPITLNNPTKEGYTFTGWTYEGQTTPVETVTITSEMTGDKVYTANFEQVATTLDKTLWNNYKETYKNDIFNVRTITTATNTAVQEGDVSIGNGVYARISGETLTIFSINDSKIILPADCSSFFYKNAGATINDEWIFSYFEKITRIDLSNFDTSNVTDMSLMFYVCNSLTSLDLSGFNTTKVTNMSSMFLNCQALTSLDLSGFNTSNVTDMESMFLWCQALTSLDVSGFDTSNVTNMSDMFADCSVLTSLDLSGIDTSNVTNMSQMFLGCQALTNITFGNNFNTANVTDMSNMFADCRALTSLDLSNFDMTNVENTESMFDNCGVLTTIYTPKALPSDTTLTINLPGATYGTTATYGLVNDNYQTTSANLMDFPVSVIDTENPENTVKQQIVRQSSVTANVNNNSYGTVTGNLTYYAGQTITEDGNTLKVGDTVIATATPATIEGYTVEFDSWDLTALASSNTVTANFARTADEYTITLNGLEEGDVYDPVAATYTIESGDITLPTNVTRERYTFLGWTGEGIEEPTKNVTILAGSTGSKTYTANFELSEFNVYGASTTNGSLVLSASQVVVGDEVVVTLSPDAHYEVDEVYYATATIEKQAISQINGEYKFTMPAEDVTVYATFKQIYYTITQDQMTNGHLEFDKSSSLYGETVTVTIVPDAGYELKSGAAVWYYTTDPEQPTPIDYDGLTGSFTMPGDNVVVCAEFEAIEYTLTLKQVDTNGAVMAVITQKYNTEIDYRSIDMYTEKTGYTFTNTWSEALPTTMPLNGGEIYGIYEINEYTITFVVDGENYQVITQDYDTTITPPTDPTKEGYTFTGWSEAVPETMPAENKTITANFEINEYTLTFVVDGENYQVITQNYGTEVIAPTDPTKTGYTFTGWSEAVPETMPAENKTITANFEINQYTITFVLGNGEENVVVEQDYGTAYNMPTDPERTGYTFGGWDREVPATIPAENITVNATWTANEYTLTIKENDTYGAVIATITQGYGTTIDYSGVDTTKYGYTFGGYSDQPQTMPLDGGEIYAYFTANGHTLYFDANGGYVDLQSTEVTYGQEYGALPIPTKDGYTFLGWYDTNGNLKADDEVYNLDSDTTFTAYWQTITYKIILIINNEVASQIPYTIESSDYTLADAQEPTGYSFLGWTGDGNTTPRKGVIIRSGSMGDKVFTAKFEANRYDIEYRDYGTPGGFSGTTDGLPTFHIYDQATTLVESTRTGYKFVGWMLNGEMVTRIAENTVAENITLDAVWEANSYDIVYRDKNNATFSGLFAGEYPEKYTYDRNTTLVSPTRVGYDFVGWFSDAACTQPITQIPAGYDTQAVTVYADWTAQQYTITYCERYGAEFGGTTTGLPTTHTYDQTTVLGTTTKEGYTFAGWYTDEDCQNQVNQIGAFTKTENFYLYAKFDANKYDIVYKDQNGADYTGATEGLPTQFVYDEQTYLPTPTRAGYDFVGWFLDQECEYQQITEIPSKYASQAVTVYAKWNEATFTVYFNTNGGYMPSGNGSMNATYLSAYGDIETPEKEYYDFAGWYSDAALTNAVNADTIYNFTQDSNLYAKWTPTVYTITLHIFNNDQTVEFTVESDSFTVARPQVEGYTFVEWLRDGNSVGADYNPTYNEAENYELTANFEAIEYTYKLQVNIELTDDQGNPVFDPEVYNVEHAYTIEDDDIALPNIDVSQYGVFFRGWTGEGLENPTTDVVIAKGSIGNRVYVAHFTGEPFTMTFDALGGEVSVESMEVRYQEEIGTLPQATKDGYTFDGWYRDQACTDGNEITADMLLTTKGDFTAYAKWKANAYKIRRNIDGVTFVTLYSPDDKAFNLPIPTKRGYKFVGWTGTDLEEMQRVVTIASGSIGDKEYVAHFELATYIITLQVNGETYDEIEYTMESRDIKIGEIEVDGYTFNGWTGEGITTPTKEIVVEMGSVGNKLYKANLTAHTYTATITIDGEEREIEFTPNSEDIVIQNPTKDGYVFLGWQAEGSTELVKNLVIKKGTVGDQAYTAVWEEAKPQEEKTDMNKTLVIGIAAGAGGLVLATGVTLGVLKLKKRRR